ncbi:MAG: hypothetical protein LBU41_01400, partial [Clostridiales Family XIII bacterium]|nr:hypothetical protein [Clostridiales Family XIII bacterium]
MDLDNVPLEEIPSLLSEALTDFFNKYPIINTIIPCFTLLVGLYYLVRAIHGKKKRALEANVFIVFCFYITFISATALFGTQFEESSATELLSLFAYLLFLSLPGIFCLHIWTQVSWKPITSSTLILYFSVPVMLWGIAIYQHFVLDATIDIWNFYFFDPISIPQIVAIIYWFFMVLKGFLLGFNVYFQMPIHMRRSTKPLTFSLVIITASLVVALFFCVQEMLLLYLLCLAVAANRCFYAFFLASSANVISTSREFIFSNLSTMVFVLSKKGHILEWNTHDNEKPLFLLNKPKYLQSFKDYREKLLEIGKGIVSPHDENII